MTVKTAGLSTLFALLAILLTSCGSAPSTPTPTSAPVSTPDPRIEAPPLLAELPLQGDLVEIPGIYITRASGSVDELARLWFTTPAELRRVNPWLQDSQVSYGTLIVIPPDLLLSQAATAEDVAAQIGLTTNVLLSTNPQIASDDLLAAGTILAAPPTVMVQADASLTKAASEYGTNDELLLSANPHLSGQESVLAGQVIVLPPGE